MYYILFLSVFTPKRSFLSVLSIRYKSYRILMYFCYIMLPKQELPNYGKIQRRRFGSYATNCFLFIPFYRSSGSRRARFLLPLLDAPTSLTTTIWHSTLSISSSIPDILPLPMPKSQENYSFAKPLSENIVKHSNCCFRNIIVSIKTFLKTICSADYLSCILASGIAYPFPPLRNKRS